MSTSIPTSTEAKEVFSEEVAVHSGLGKFSVPMDDAELMPVLEAIRSPKLILIMEGGRTIAALPCATLMLGTW